jgi:hypothetical protein
MADTAKVNTTYTAEIAKVSTTAIANIASMDGVTWVSTAETVFNNVIAYSCLFDSASSTYMQYTPAAAGTEETWTYSCWIKRSNLGSIQILLNAAAGEEISFTAADKLRFTTATGDLLTTAVYRDCSGWYHIVVAVDTTQATAADRVNIYVNGSKVETYDTETYMNQNEVTDFLKASAHTLGANEGGTEEFDGYMAEFVLIDGTQYAASDFGETDSGIWTPKEVSGLTFGTYGTWLDFADSADLGDDNSGNTNDWTETNFGADHQVTDTPEANHCTLDYNVTRSNMTTFKEGGLIVNDAGAAYHSALGTFLMKSGKWYWELTVGADTTFPGTGICPAGEYSGDIIISNLVPTTLMFHIQCNGSAAAYQLYEGTSLLDSLGSPAAAETVKVAFDADNNKLWFGTKEDGWYNSGNPAAGTNATYDSSDGIDADLYDWIPWVYTHTGGSLTMNFGQRTFADTVPTGFKALSTANITSPTVDDPQDEYINAVTYEGDGAASNAITGVGFQSDLVWIKNRDAADQHQLYDSVRGSTKTISIDHTNKETTDADGLLSFDADGFTVGAGNEVNTNTENYVAWCFKKQSGFFDIQTYTGTGAAHTENHDLGVIPSCIIVKSLDTEAHWYMYHHHALNKTDPETDYGLPSVINRWEDSNTIWNDTAPTTTQFSVGSHNDVNKLDDNFIAYLFADVNGISKAFSYEGNGSAAGPYIYCGFKPRWIIVKNADSGAHGWIMIDTARDTVNPTARVLYSYIPNAENASSTHPIDVFSNGFKIRATTVDYNSNNGTIVGIAFSDQPFNYANAG